MNRFFTYLNLFPMPLWLAMMFAPRHPVTERMGRSSTIFGLGALHYVIAIIIALKHGPQERKQAGQIQTVNVTTLDGIRELLSIRSGTLAAWAHMLALDLFTGGWIYRQSRQLNAPDLLLRQALHEMQGKNAISHRKFSPVITAPLCPNLQTERGIKCDRPVHIGDVHNRH